MFKFGSPTMACTSNCFQCSNIVHDHFRRLPKSSIASNRFLFVVVVVVMCVHICAGQFQIEQQTDNYFNVFSFWSCSNPPSSASVISLPIAVGRNTFNCRKILTRQLSQTTFSKIQLALSFFELFVINPHFILPQSQQRLAFKLSLSKCFCSKFDKMHTKRQR